jgi:hypothetical protein
MSTGRAAGYLDRLLGTKLTSLNRITCSLCLDDRGRLVLLDGTSRISRARHASAHFAAAADWAGNARCRPRLFMTPAAGAHRWGIAVRALELEDEIVRQLGRSFHRLPEAALRDAYADAWERACRPIGQPGAFPEDDLRGLPGWLHRSTSQRLMHVARDTGKWRADSPAALEQRCAGATDPAEIVAHKEALARVAAELAREPSDVRTYFLADRVDGARRHQIRARTGWSQDKVKHLRKKMAAALERAAIAALPPLPLGRSVADALTRAKAALYGLIGYAPAAEGALGSGSNAIVGARLVATGCAAVIIGGSGLCAEGRLLPVGDHPSTRARHVLATAHRAAAATSTRRRSATPGPTTTTRRRLIAAAPAAIATSPAPSRSPTRKRQRLRSPEPARELASVHATATGDDFGAATFEAPPPATPVAPSALRASKSTTPAASSPPPSPDMAGDFAADAFENGP